MSVELTPRERNLLLQLVEAEIRELGPEIHHTRTYKDPLKEQRRELRSLWEHLMQVAPGEADASVAQSSARDLIGTP